MKPGNKDNCPGNSIADTAIKLIGDAGAWLSDVSGLTGDDLKQHMDKIGDWSAETIQANLNVDNLKDLSDKALAATSEAWAKMDTTQLEAIKAKFDGLVKSIPKDELVLMGMDAVNTLDTSQIQAFKDQLAGITLEDVSTWTDKKLKEIPIDNLAEMGWEVLQKIPIEEVGAWTQENWNTLPVDKLVRMTGEQLAKIDAGKVTDLGDDFWDALPVYQVTKFSVELLQSGDFLSHLNASHVAAMTKEQWTDFPLDKMAKFTIEQIQAVDYEALGEWTKDKWDKVPIEKVSDMVGKQIESMDAEFVGSWTKEQWDKFPAEKVIMFTGKQLKEGAAALKDFSDERLAEFDMDEFTAEVMAALPQDVQDRIIKIKASDEMAAAKKKLKDLYGQSAKLQKELAAKLKAYQEKLNSATATQAEKDSAQQSYDAAVVVSEKMTADVKAAEVTINPALATDDQSSAARVAPALLAVVLAVGVSM